MDLLKLYHGTTDLFQLSELRPADETGNLREEWRKKDTNHKLVKAGMAQSMSRVAKCIDNGPMESFWGILKRERYYGRRFTSKKELTDMIENYIRWLTKIL